jgi:hypothetical protein
MTAEHTLIHPAIQRLTMRAPGVRPSAAVDDAVECPGARSTGRRTRRWIVSLATAVWRALTAWGNPSFFEFGRRAPEHHRLGPGLSRVSDSFWPLTEW